jgi:hypothetical protein
MIQQQTASVVGFNPSQHRKTYMIPIERDAVGEKKKKTTLGWVVNGGRRHAGQQGNLIPRSHAVGELLQGTPFLDEKFCEPSRSAELRSD